MGSTDDIFSLLPRPTQRRIDDAFYLTAATTSNQQEPAQGGGFVLSNLTDQIPLDLVPATLRHLNIPEDEEVLAVFRNSATGWKVLSLSEQEMGDAVHRLAVNLDDWRAVCSVLLEEEGKGEDHGDFSLDGSGRQDRSDNKDQDASYSEHSATDDEFVPQQLRGGKRLRRFNNTATTEPASPSKLTPYQKQSALDTFSLFFPHVSLSDLVKQKLMIKDIQRVVLVLKEKLTAEEVVDMLEMFSTSSDKAVTYSDFIVMLIQANLI